MEKKVTEKKSTTKKTTTKKPAIVKKKPNSVVKEVIIKEPIIIETSEELIVQNNPKSRISEAIKSIKTNLQFAAVDQNIKTIMITSSVPGEGKSFIAANLASAFAASNIKVLIVDCDLRKGRQHQIFKISNNKGLSNLLIDSVDNYKKYIKSTAYSNIKVLTSGMLAPNPSELLGSIKNKDLMEVLKKNFDIIILDCPPVNGLADSLVMTALADSVLIVCAQNRTKMALLEDTKKALVQLNAKVTGVIMNKVDVNDTDDYYRYYN